MTASVRLLARTLLVLALAFNGWAAPAHAHGVATADDGRAATAAPYEADCHDAAEELDSAVTTHTMPADCCSSGDCQACSCVTGSCGAMPGRQDRSLWPSVSASHGGASRIHFVNSTGQPLRPPIA